MINKLNIPLGLQTFSWITGIFFLSLSILPGCTWDIYDSMHVTKGNAPEMQDDDVLFRNIYYFRVFEYCPTKKGKIFTKDNLFRFRMTGKGYPLFLNKVRFEAGTLHKSEIDPFGNPITFDKKSGHFRYTTKQEIELEKKNFTMEVFDKEYEHLLQLAEKLDDNKNPLKDSKLFKEYIDTRINDLTKAVKSQPMVSDSPSGFVTACNNGNNPKQEFWILGPEGWRRFNADDRLVLAMSTSGEPIIGPMKELAGRILNEQVPDDTEQQVYEVEQIRINTAERYLTEQENSGSKDKPEKIIDTILEKLSDKNDSQGVIKQ